VKDSRLSRLFIEAFLCAYLIIGILSPKTLLGQTETLKLDNSLSGQNEHSVVLDELPFWTFHKHLTSYDELSDHENLSSSEPWIGNISSEQPGEFRCVFLPIDSNHSSPAALRAPPLS